MVDNPRVAPLYSHQIVLSAKSDFVDPSTGSLQQGHNNLWPTFTIRATGACCKDTKSVGSKCEFENRNIQTWLLASFYLPGP